MVARRPTAGLGLAREHRPAAVLLAGDMPRVDSVLGQLKKHPDTRHVPVAMIGEPASRIDALRAGAAAFVPDPLEDGELERTLAELERQTEAAGRRLALIEEDGARLDDETLGYLTGDDLVELRRIDAAGALAELRAASSTSRSWSSATRGRMRPRCYARSASTSRCASTR